jgi:alkanesulfonate monooxygenase SsuD/methylene tetrahydromethanopterin reductase-like flavin-dependent oxidoreductase (luciferase family)
MTTEFGFLAVPADVAGVSDAELYGGLLESCAVHRDLGYGTAWFLEHHFSDYYPCPAPTVLMAHIAARFPDLALGTCVLVAPWYEPLRLAGELAMLSHLTDQPLYIGLGRGTAKYEYDAFGLDMTQARERFADVWRVLERAMTGERFTYEGKHVQVATPVQIRPTPVRDRVEFFGAIGSASSTAVMAELGLAPMCTSFGALTPELLPAWEARAREVGTIDRVSSLRPLLVNVIIADSDEDAIAEAKQYMPRFMQAQVDHYGAHHVAIGSIKGYEAWNATFENWKRMTDPEQIPAWTPSQIVGSPETVARRVRDFAEAGFNHIILHTVVPGTPRRVQLRWAERFAREIVPQFAAGTPVAAPRSGA